MRRMAFVLLCLLALGLGSCRRVSPPSLDNGTTVVDVPADAGQHVDLSQALMALVPEAQAELDQALDVSWAAGILKGTLSSIPATEMLGQELIDDLVAVIDELQETSSTSTSGGSGRLAILASPARNGDDGGNIQVQRPIDEDGFSGEMSVNISIEEKGDRVVTNAEVSMQLHGTAPDKLGQALEVRVTQQGDQDACPKAEGETAGTFSASSYTYINGTRDGAAASFGRTVIGQIGMEAYNAEDGTLDQADLSLEGSVNYEITGQSWGTSFTSQANGVNPKDNNSILSQLTENRQGDSSLPPTDLRIPTENFVEAISEAITFPLSILVPGTRFAEKLWLTANKCIEITITPEDLRLAPGESETVEAEVVLNADGGSVAADIEAEALGEGGQISPEKANSSPGATASFAYTAPDDGPPGSFSLEATSKAGKAYKEVNVNSPKIEWSGTFTMAGSSTIQDVGTSQGTTTFTIRFQADLNPSGSEGGGLIPFELESDASMSWSGTATALGIVQPFSGSTSNIIIPNYSNPEWVSALPDGDCLAGEGYIDLSAKKLYLFLLGIGDQTGYGTFNLSPNTTCNYHHDQTTNRVYLVFPLDDEYKIADGSCGDRISADTGGQGGMKVQSTRSWHFETQYVSETQAGP